MNIRGFGNYFSADTFESAAGVAGGILAGEYVGQTLSAKLEQTGWTEIAILGAVKAGLGYLFYRGSSATSGTMGNILKAGSIGCMASVISDVIAQFWSPSGGGTTSRKVSTPSRSVSVGSASSGKTLSADEL